MTDSLPRHTSTGDTVECCAFVLGPLAGGERWSLATDRPKWTTVVECHYLLLSEGSTDATVLAIIPAKEHPWGALRSDQAVRPTY